jgi:SSS family solute:Na+ symporter
MNAGAVAFTQDIVRPFKRVSDATALNVGRVATVVIAAVAAAGAVGVPSIIDGLIRCYTIWAPAILPALVLGLWLRHPRPMAGILSMAVGAGVAILLQIVQLVAPAATRIPVIIPALGAALLAYLIGHAVGRPELE